MDRRLLTHAGMLARWLRIPFLAALVACGASSTSPSPPPAASETQPAAPVAAETPAPAPNALADAVDALFEAAAAKDAFSGSVIVVDGGKEVLAKGYGSADRKTKRKNAPDTIFRIGSVSKQFAASAVLALVQDGKLALTDPVSKYFPEYPKENLTKDGLEVTLHHLISHTSGLPDPRGTAAFKRAVWNRVIAPSEQVGFAKALPLVDKPGAAFAYLNFNFLLAALVVEKVSGQPYESFVHKRFFEPLGMKDTGTLLPAGVSDRAALGYYDDSGELATMMDDASFKDRDVSFAFGSGQIYSTVKDLARWDRALTSDATLAAAQRDLLFKPNLDDYGYGWVIQKKNGVTFEWHNGAISPLGFTALVVRVRSKDRFVAYLANLDLELVQPFEAKVMALAVK
jgi:CubicO group peptidase (beta-lactamase class C family)